MTEEPPPKNATEDLDAENVDAEGLKTGESFFGEGRVEKFTFEEEVGVAALGRNLVHRDFKPINFRITWLPGRRFLIKFVDFGLAQFPTRPLHQTIAHGDLVFGSIRFMAPQQFERQPLDQRTDMHAIGSVFYYCLTGIYPFNGESAPQVMASHLQHKVTLTSEIRPDLPAWLCN